MDSLRVGAGLVSAPTTEVGTKLPELSLFGDPTFIVSTAIATRRRTHATVIGEPAAAAARTATASAPLAVRHCAHCSR